MKQSVSLLVKNQLDVFVKLDLYKDETISLTQTIQNVKDIGKIFTDFTQSFTLPASKINNKLFNNYWNVEIENGFNANVKLDAMIRLSTGTFRIGYLALNGSTLKNNKPYTYKVSFFGETVDLKKKLKNIDLESIMVGTSRYDHEYSHTKVSGGVSSINGVFLPNANSGSIIYPLISHTRRPICDSSNPSNVDVTKVVQVCYAGSGSTSPTSKLRYTDLKPAIRVTELIDRIEEYTEETFGVNQKLRFNRTHPDSFFRTDNIRFMELYMWLARQKGDLRNSLNGTEDLFSIICNDLQVDSSGGSYHQWDAATQDYNPGSIYDIDLQGAPISRSRIVNGLWLVTPVSYSGFQGVWAIGSTSYEINWETSSSDPHTIFMEEITTGSPVVLASHTAEQNGGVFEARISPNMGDSRIEATGETRKIRFRIESGFSNFTYQNELTLRFKFSHYFSVGGPMTGYSSGTLRDSWETNPLVTNSDIIISRNIPKIKVLEFLTGMFKMFNLTAYVLRPDPRLSCDAISIQTPATPVVPTLIRYNDCFGIEITFEMNPSTIQNIEGDPSSVTVLSGATPTITTTTNQNHPAGSILVTELDKYYARGIKRDITEYIDETEREVNFAVPYQELSFKFEEPKTFLAYNFGQINNATFGDLDSVTTENSVQATDRGNKYNIKAPFEKLLYERMFDSNTAENRLSNLSFGWSADKDQNAYLTKTLLFYRKRQNAYAELPDGTNSNLKVYLYRETPPAFIVYQYYNRPSNSVGYLDNFNSINSTLHFSTEIDEFFFTTYQNSLFYQNYRNYIGAAFNTRRRKIIVKAVLPLKFLLTYSLADCIVINTTEYVINSITTDITTGESKLELFNKTLSNGSY